MEPYVGEIMMFGGSFPPRGWAFCDGQLLAVSDNDALFSLLGTIYGGDGRTTFGLPDLRGRLPTHAGQGPGLSDRRLGSKGGQETVTLTQNQLPNHAHVHTLSANPDPATTNLPGGNIFARSIDEIYGEGTAAEVRLHPDAVNVGTAGESRSHENMPPFLCVHFCIALFGIYPSRQ